MSKLRCGVIGVGYLGRFHAQKYAALSAVDFVGVYDLSSSQAAGKLLDPIQEKERGKSNF